MVFCSRSKTFINCCSSPRVFKRCRASLKVTSAIIGVSTQVFDALVANIGKSARMLHQTLISLDGSMFYKPQSSSASRPTMKRSGTLGEIACEPGTSGLNGEGGPTYVIVVPGCIRQLEISRKQRPERSTVYPPYAPYWRLPFVKKPQLQANRLHVAQQSRNETPFHTFKNRPMDFHFATKGPIGKEGMESRADNKNRKAVMIVLTVNARLKREEYTGIKLIY